jgi:antitoxin HigA-1
MKKLPNIHPGEVLREEFLIPLEISQYRLAKEIGVPEPRISAVNGRSHFPENNSLDDRWLFLFCLGR